MFLKVMKKIFKILSLSILVILMIFGCFLLLIFLINKYSEAKGKQSPIGLFTIVTSSMEPNIMVDDGVFVLYTEPSRLKKGDVITFYSTNSYFGGTPLTHRIVEVYNNSVNNCVGYCFRTQGDANPLPDEDLAISNNIIGKVIFKIPQIGKIQFMLSTKKGWFSIVLIPALLIITYDIYKLIKLLFIKKEITKTK